jgi:hypothetical protein
VRVRHRRGLRNLLFANWLVLQSACWHSGIVGNAYIDQRGFSQRGPIESGAQMRARECACFIHRGPRQTESFRCPPFSPPSPPSPPFCGNSNMVSPSGNSVARQRADLLGSSVSPHMSNALTCQLKARPTLSILCPIQAHNELSLTTAALLAVCAT